jgi:hypothetical protein
MISGNMAGTRTRQAIHWAMIPKTIIPASSSIGAWFEFFELLG